MPGTSMRSGVTVKVHDVRRNHVQQCASVQEVLTAMLRGGKDPPGSQAPPLWCDVRYTPQHHAREGSSAATPALMLNEVLLGMQEALGLPMAAVLSALERVSAGRVHHATGTLYCAIPVIMHSDGGPALDGAPAGGPCCLLPRALRRCLPGWACAEATPGGGPAGADSDDAAASGGHLHLSSLAGSESSHRSQLAQRLRATWTHVHLFMRHPFLISVGLPDGEFQTSEAVISASQTLSRVPVCAGAGAGAGLVSALLGHSAARRVDDAERAPITLVFHALLESLVQQPGAVLRHYRDEIRSYHGRTFRTLRHPSARSDAHQTLQLYLMCQELGTLRLHLQPTCRLLDTLMGPARALLCEQVVDFLEEVRDTAGLNMTQVNMLQDEARAMMDLLFSLAAYRSTLSQQILAGVSVLFVPLTWWAGIYGTNFAILPELTWGVDVDADPGAATPPGWPAGYMYFWLVMAGMAALSGYVLHTMRVFTWW